MTRFLAIRTVGLVSSLALFACGSSASELPNPAGAGVEETRRSGDVTREGAREGAPASTCEEVATTACAPEVGADFFDGAALGEAPLLNPPCGAGTVFRRPELDAVTAPVRFTSQADLSAAHCVSQEGAEPSGPSVDFATHDVVAVAFDDMMMSPQKILEVAGELWVREAHSTCVRGAGLVVAVGFYVVPKGVPLHVRSCVTSCVVTGDCPPRA